MEMKLRHAEEHERDPNGASTQLISMATCKNFPIALEKAIAFERETDLMRKEWLQDCRRTSGEVTGPENLMTSLMHAEISSPLMPVVLDAVQLRRFVVCQTAPCAGVGPGVLKTEISPPSDAETHEGIAIPKPGPRVIRMEAKNYVYFMPGRRPDVTEVVIVGELGMPLPSWMVPLGLLSRFASDFITKTFIMVKEDVYDHWKDWQFDERIAANDNFYGSIAKLSSPTAARAMP